MEKKHLIMAVAGILIAALLLGLGISHFGSRTAPETTDPTGETTAATAGPGETTAGTEPGGETTAPTAGTEPVGETTAPTTVTDPSGETTAPTTAPTAPTTAPTTEPTTAPTTVPTEPGHEHTYEKGETVLPTLSAPGYTLYTCTGCGASYQGDPVAALTLQSVINDMELNPATTGIPELDSAVRKLLGQITGENDGTYDKLMAIYNYQLEELSHGGGELDASKIAQFSQDKVFKNAGELVIAYEANQLLEEGKGISDQYAALFCTLTRAVGLESYVVNGTLNGSNHVWNNIMIDGQLYTFDTYTTTAPQFAKTDSEVSGYVCTNRDSSIANQSGFRSADAFTVSLTVQGSTGTETYSYTWNLDDVRSGTANFMRNQQVVRPRGDVTYTLEVTSGSGSFVFTDENGNKTQGTSFTGTLASGSGYHVLTIEEENSMMAFDIRIDN